MVSISRVIVTVGAIMIVGGCTMHEGIALHKARLKVPAKECIAEVKSKAAELAGTKQLRVSDDLFQKSSLLVLTSMPAKPYPFDNPMVGVVGAQKMLRLYRDDQKCWIALVNDSAEVVKKLPLDRCHCVDEEVH